MKSRHFIISLVILLLAGWAGIAFTDPPDIKEFKKLYMLQGRWMMKTKKGAVGEEWVRVGKNYMQSTGYIIKGTDTTVTERVALRRTRDGIFYISTVEEQNQKQPVSFKLASVTDSLFVFENLQHDFPKRICYKLINKDSVHAWIDDAVDNSKKRSNFYYSRVP